MARKTNADTFDFSKAKGSSGRTAFRTPMMGGISQADQRRYAEWNKARQWGNVDSKGRIMVQAGVSPYKAIAMFFAKLARAGVGGAGEASALANVARRVPSVRLNAGAKFSELGMEEAKRLLTDYQKRNPAGYSSVLFEDGVRNLFRPGEIKAIYSAFSKVQGNMTTQLFANMPRAIAAGLPREVVRKATKNSLEAGRILKRAGGNQ